MWRTISPKDKKGRGRGVGWKTGKGGGVGWGTQGRYVGGSDLRWCHFKGAAKLDEMRGACREVSRPGERKT